MIGSAALHGTGWVEGGLPVWARDAAMVFVGTMIGGRLSNISPRIFLTYLTAGAGSIVVGMSVAALFCLRRRHPAERATRATIFAYVPARSTR